MCRVLLTPSNSSNETLVSALRMMVIQATDDLEMLHSALCRNRALVVGLL
jgi:hypothetical protein